MNFLQARRGHAPHRGGIRFATTLAPKITGLKPLFGLVEFLYIALLVQLIANGAGALSLDRLLAGAPRTP